MLRVLLVLPSKISNIPINIVRGYLFYHSSWNSGNNGERWNIVCYDAIGTNNTKITYGKMIFYYSGACCDITVVAYIGCRCKRYIASNVTIFTYDRIRMN